MLLHTLNTICNNIKLNWMWNKHTLCLLIFWMIQWKALTVKIKLNIKQSILRWCWSCTGPILDYIFWQHILVSIVFIKYCPTHHRHESRWSIILKWKLKLRKMKISVFLSIMFFICTSSMNFWFKKNTKFSNSWSKLQNVIYVPVFLLLEFHGPTGPMF